MKREERNVNKKECVCEREIEGVTETDSHIKRRREREKEKKKVMAQKTGKGEVKKIEEKG